MDLLAITRTEGYQCGGVRTGGVGGGSGMRWPVERGGIFVVMLLLLSRSSTLVWSSINNNLDQW